MTTTPADSIAFDDDELENIKKRWRLRARVLRVMSRLKARRLRHRFVHSADHRQWDHAGALVPSKETRPSSKCSTPALDSISNG